MGATCLKAVFGESDISLSVAWDESDVNLKYIGFNKKAHGENEAITNSKINSNTQKLLLGVSECEFLKISTYYDGQVVDPEIKSFTDDKFPPNENSLIYLNPNNEATKDVTTEELNILKSFKWKRVSELMKRDYVLYEKIEIEDIHQGSIGNCYFLSAVAAVAEFHDRFDRIFVTKTRQQNGCYSVRFVIQGIPEIVVVDDFFPAIENRFAGATSGFKEIWVQILEKAWAKINDSYASTIAGLPGEALAALTRSPVVSYIHKKFSEERTSELWNIIKDADKKNYILCTNTGNNKDAEDMGLVNSHAYTIIGVFETQGLRLVKLRNPWGSFEWKGDFTDKSEKWNQYPGLKENVKFANTDDGIFYMTFKDFLTYYPYTFICKYENGFMYNFQKVEQKSNDQMTCAKISITQPTKIVIGLHQKQQRFYKKVPGYKSQFGRIILAKYNNLDHTYEFIQSDANDNEKLYIEIELLLPGEYHIFANVYWPFNTPCRYIISTYASNSVEVEKLEVKNICEDYLTQILTSYMDKNCPVTKMNNCERSYQYSIKDNDLGFYLFSFYSEAAAKISLNMEYSQNIDFLSASDVVNRRSEKNIENKIKESFDINLNKRTKKLFVWKLNANPWSARMEPSKISSIEVDNNESGSHETVDNDDALILHKIKLLKKKNLSLDCFYTELDVKDGVIVIFENQSPDEMTYQFKVEITNLKNLKNKYSNITQFEVIAGTFKKIRLVKINPDEEYTYSLKYSFKRT